MEQAFAPSDRIASNLLKSGSIIILGGGIGMLSSLYSPVLALIMACLFTAAAAGLYISSASRAATTRVAVIVSPAKPKQESNLLFYLCYLSFLLSITIPKSGKTVGSIPITTANILILVTLLAWSLKFFLVRDLASQIPLFTPLALLMGYGMVSGLIGIVNGNPYRTIVLEFVAFFGFIPVYFLVCSVVRTQTHLKYLTWGFIVSCVLVCTYGILQVQLGFQRVAIPGITEQYGMIMYQEFGGRWNIIEGGAQKLYSTFQNGNIFGHHLATYLPFLGGIIIGIRSFWKKSFLAAIFVFAWYILLLTYSRGALFGAISGLVIFVMISQRFRLRAMIVTSILAMALLLFLNYYAERPQMTRYDLRRVTEDPNQFSSGRLERAKETLAGFARLSLLEKCFGLGLGGVLISPLYWRFEYVDNLFLTMLFKMGFVGLIFLSWNLWLLLRTLLKWRALTPDIPIQGMISGGIAGLMGSLIHNLADVLWLFPPLSANFWFLAGITMCMGMIGAQSAQISTSQNPKV